MGGVKKNRGSATRGGGRKPAAGKPAGRKAVRRAASGKPGVKSARGAKPVAKKAAGRKPAARRPSRAAVRKPAVAKAPVGKPGKRTRKRPRVPERTVVRIRDLDPYRKCGPGTSVERLIRVDEMVDRQLEAHLVFFDRHGWYCEHGQGCPAVGHARKHAAHAERPVW